MRQQLEESELMNVDILDSANQHEWDDFTSACPESTFFHTYDWWRLLRHTEGLPLYWGLWFDDKLVAIWPTSLIPTFGGRLLRIVRAPATNEGIDATLLHGMFIRIADATRKRSVLRWDGDFPESSPFVEFAFQCGFERTPNQFCDYTLALEESALLWKRLAKQARNAVRQGTKQGLDVRESCEPGDLVTFFSIYKSTMERRRFGSPFRFDSSLAHLLSVLIQEDRVRLFTASDRNRMIAGILLLLHKRRVFWWLGGSLPDSWRMRPNELLLWHAIEWASRSQFCELDLGWTPAEQTHGLHTFKRHFGGQHVNLVHLNLTVNRLRDSLASSLARSGRRVYERGLIPKWIVRLTTKNRWV